LTNWPQGYGLARHAELDSTNSEARRLAEAGQTGPVWIMADRQTAGRGRRGRVWETLTGNLAATLLLPKPADAAQLSFAGALAVSDAAMRFVPQVTVTVKWPNDVLADGRKLSGILLEAGDTWLAVGIGVNLATAPTGTEFPAASLAEFGVATLPETALTEIAARFAHWYDAWMDDGFEILRAAWLARAQQLGQPVRARLPHEECHGVFEGISGDGALLLNEQGRTRVITAGEVFF
jgi:BirA family biotin operon repressor/biotin-[acetyl-CoA-carboxylase] ligase